MLRDQIRPHPAGPRPTSVRQLRVGETMRRILAGILARDDKPVTITEVRVSPDLRNATVFFLQQTAPHDLEANRGRLRAQIAAAMRLKRAPALTFAADSSLSAAQAIDRLLKQPQVSRDLVFTAPEQAPAPAPAPASPPSGWLILDKPAGITSARATAQVKRLAGAAKAGHCGTLDPDAEGVLPIALGEATKLVRFLVDARKTYRFTIEWLSPPPSPAAIQAALATFLGEIEQVPPRLSAIHVNGKRAYALARAGVAFDLAARRVHLYAASLLDGGTIEITCSKGFYVRSLARDLAAALGAEYRIASLRRTAVGPFADPLPLPETRAALLARLQPVETILSGGGIASLGVSAAEEMRLRWGQGIFLSSPDEKSDVACPPPGKPMLALRDGKAVALVCRGAAGEIKPVRVLHPHTSAGAQEKQGKETEGR